MAQPLTQNDLTTLGWVDGSLWPGEGFYPTGAAYPHLHVTLMMDGSDSVMAYLGYHTSSSNRQVIFDRANAVPWQGTIVTGLEGEIATHAAGLAGYA
jgi:hypothetical protein